MALSMAAVPCPPQRPPMPMHAAPSRLAPHPALSQEPATRGLMKPPPTPLLGRRRPAPLGTGNEEWQRGQAEPTGQVDNPGDGGEASHHELENEFGRNATPLGSPRSSQGDEDCHVEVEREAAAERLREEMEAATRAEVEEAEATKEAETVAKANAEAVTAAKAEAEANSATRAELEARVAAEAEAVAKAATRSRLAAEAKARAKLRAEAKARATAKAAKSHGTAADTEMDAEATSQAEVPRLTPRELASKMLQVSGLAPPQCAFSAPQPPEAAPPSLPSQISSPAGSSFAVLAAQARSKLENRNPGLPRPVRPVRGVQSKALEAEETDNSKLQVSPPKVRARPPEVVIPEEPGDAPPSLAGCISDDRSAVLQASIGFRQPSSTAVQEIAPPPAAVASPPSDVAPSLEVHSMVLQEPIRDHRPAAYRPAPPQALPAPMPPSSKLKELQGPADSCATVLGTARSGSGRRHQDGMEEAQEQLRQAWLSKLAAQPNFDNGSKTSLSSSFRRPPAASLRSTAEASAVAGSELGSPQGSQVPDAQGSSWRQQRQPGQPGPGFGPGFFGPGSGPVASAGPQIPGAMPGAMPGAAARGKGPNWAFCAP